MRQAQQLIQRIFETAAYIGEQDGPAVTINYNSQTHQLRVVVKNAWSEPPIIDECANVPRIVDPELTRIRKGRDLLDMLDKLSAVTRLSPRPAA